MFPIWRLSSSAIIKNCEGFYETLKQYLSVNRFITRLLLADSQFLGTLKKYMLIVGILIETFSSFDFGLHNTTQYYDNNGIIST